MILSMCICSNTSKDASARAPSRWRMWQGWSNLDGQSFSGNPSGWNQILKKQDTIWWLPLSPGLYICTSSLICFVSWHGGSKLALKHQLVREMWTFCFYQTYSVLMFKVLFCKCKCTKLHIFEYIQMIWIQKSTGCIKLQSRVPWFDTLVFDARVQLTLI